MNTFYFDEEDVYLGVLSYGSKHRVIYSDDNQQTFKTVKTFNKLGYAIEYIDYKEWKENNNEN